MGSVKRKSVDGERAGRGWYSARAEVLAERLLGQRLVRVLEDGTRLWGRIVETEAYPGGADRASHSYNGRRTARNESMYAVGGTAYVYFTYGMHHCMNVVCGEEDEGCAVLVRALEPPPAVPPEPPEVPEVPPPAPEVEAGRVREVMRAHRVAASRARKVVDGDAWLCSGPARLCQALAIDRGLDGEDMVGGGRLWVELVGEGPVLREGEVVARSARIGIGNAGEWAGKELRWYLRGNACVSGRG